jgi:uncharacterized protein (TIGR02996 family)
VPEVVRAKDARHVVPDASWIARIAAAYDDDVPRLVYADHLQSLGDPLGELIAVQCELARIDRWEARAGELREREETLLRTYRQRWLPKLEPEIRCTFRRGFVEHVAIDTSVPAASFERLMQHAPLVRSFEHDGIRYWLSGPPWQSAAKLLPQLTGLALRGWPGRVVNLHDLLGNPQLRGIERLALRACGMSPGELEPISTRAWRELDLHNNVLGLRGTEMALADVSRLETLDLGSCGIGDSGAAAIAAAPFARLRQLKLRRSQLTAVSLRRLARSPQLSTLEVLDVSGNAGASGLFDSPELPALRELDVSETELDDDGLAALLASPLAAQLRVLDVSGNNLTDARLFIEAELPELRVLEVSRNALGERAKELKASLPHVRVTARNSST